MSQTEIRTPIYFKREGDYDREQTRLNAWKGDSRNKTLIQGYQRFLAVKGSQKPRIAKLTRQLRVICDHLPTTLDTCTKTHIETLIAWINQNEKWTVVTRSDYRRAIKSFYNWYKEEDPRRESEKHAEVREATKLYDYIAKHVSTTYQKRAIDYATIITDEDAHQLITTGCRSSMERAIIAVLHETGCRVGELLNIRIRDIERKERYAMLRLFGKTGERRVPIGQSLPYIYQWLQDHPDKHNPNSLLWISTSQGFFGLPLNYIGIERLLLRTFERAGLKKRRNPHWFRHSRATIYASRYSEQILCKFMGWTIGSAQVRTYVHLNNEQVEKAYQEENGISESTSHASKPQYCVCGAVNVASADFCNKCGNALTIATVLEKGDLIAASHEEALQNLMEIMSDPVRLQKFQEFVKQKQKGNATLQKRNLVVTNK